MIIGREHLAKYLIDYPGPTKKEESRALPPLPGTTEDNKLIVVPMEPNVRCISVQATRPASYANRARKSNEYKATVTTSLASVDTFK